jgi:hypothetical protein
MITDWGARTAVQDQDTISWFEGFLVASPPTYAVTYDGNGNDGGMAPVDASSPYDPGDTVTVLGNTGSLTKTGEVFITWNTAADGSGTDHAPGSTFIAEADVTLYARYVTPGAGSSYNRRRRTWAQE